MTGRHIHVEIDATVEADTVSGSVTSGLGSGRRFSGRLGLMTAVDEALDEEAGAIDTIEGDR